MRHRFHRAPLIQAADLLLQETHAQGADTCSMPILLTFPKSRNPCSRLSARASPTSSVPSAHLLSNGRYAVMYRSGSGYSLCGTWR